MTKHIKVELLILDDFSLQGLDRMARESFIDIIDEPYDRRGTIIVEQILVAMWHGLIGEETIADALMDRIIHSSHRITLQGESLKKKKALVELKKMRF